MRLCKADGKNAIFHGFFQHAKPVPPSAMRGGDNGGQLMFPVAVVEFEDGKVTWMSVEYIVFYDNEETLMLKKLMEANKCSA